MPRPLPSLVPALALAAGCAAQDGPEPPPPWGPPSDPGPYGVGVETLEVTDPRGKALVIEVWYPASVEPGTPPDPYEEIRIAIGAHREADPDLRGAPYPLVAFSHGYSGIRYQSAFLTEHLASHGYVVVAPDHAGNTLLDLQEDETLRVMLERPDDVRYAVDALIEASTSDHPRLAGMARPGDYAAMGHSFGAFTSMVLGGGLLDPEGLIDYCASDGAFFCGYVPEGTDPSVADGHGTGDDRAVVTVPLAPGVWYAFGEGGAGLADVREPLVLGGTADDVLPYDDEIRPCFEAMAPRKRMGTLQDAGHYAFSDICEIAPFITADCDEAAAGRIEMDLAHAVTKALVTAFLDVHLAGEVRSSPWLGPTYTDTVPELTWEVELEARGD